mgnify:CR=1 FL=1
MEDLNWLKLLTPRSDEKTFDEKTYEADKTISKYIINDILHSIFVKMSEGALKSLTRGGTSRVTRSCRDWVLFYTLLDTYSEAVGTGFLNELEISDSIVDLQGWKKKNQDHLETISQIIKQIHGHVGGVTYYKIMYLNRPLLKKKILCKIECNLGSDTPEDTPEDMCCPWPGREGKTKWTLCIHTNTGIYHYFLLLLLDNEYYITSSYGSDFITVTQYTTKISDIDDFNSICQLINRGYPSDDDEKNRISGFISKYFLLENEKVRIDAETIEDRVEDLEGSVKYRKVAKLKAEYISSDDAREMEINHLFTQSSNKENPLMISYIKGYDTYVRGNMFDWVVGAGWGARWHEAEADTLESHEARRRKGMSINKLKRSRNRSRSRGRGRSRDRSSRSRRGRSRRRRAKTSSV